MALGPWGNEASATASFSGTWITNPDEPADSVVLLRYGGVGRQFAADTAKTAMQFVGRQFPVYDVGEAQAESISVETTITGDDFDAKAQLAMLSKMIREGKVMLYRDGRGRKTYAVATDLQVEDLEQGSYKVTFLLNRVDYDEGLTDPDDSTTPVTDTQPKNLQITVDDYSGIALLSWDPVADTQIYHIYLNGVEVGSTSDSASTYGPLNSGDYVLEVSAVVGGQDSPRSTQFPFSVARPTIGGGPSNTVPQNFRAFPKADNSATLQADPVSGATQYQLFEAKSPNGVANGVSTTPNWTRGTAPNPLSDGPYDYWCKAFVNGTWSAESNHQQFTLPFGGGGPGGTAGSTTQPVIRSSSTGGKSATSSGSVVVTKPAGLVVGDYLIALDAGDADIPLSSMTASGFSELAAQAPTSATNIPSLKIFGKVATSGDVSAANFTFPSNSTGDGTVILIAIKTGTYDTTTPIVVGGFTTQARTSSMTQTAASLTSVAGGMVMAVYCSDSNAKTQAYPASGPSTFTQVASVQGTDKYSVLGAYWKIVTAGGSTGSISVSPTPSTTTNGWTAVQLMVKPLVVAGSGGGGGGGVVSGTLPSPPEVLGIKNGDPGYLHYNLGVGFSDSKGHKDYYLQVLEDWTTATADELKNNYYTVIDAAGKYVVAMTVDPDGATTSPNTSYARAEHREMAQTDVNNANKSTWDPTVGDNDFSGFSRVMTLPPAKPGVCINQMHDQQDDVVMIKSVSLSGKIAMVLHVFGTRVAVLQADYKLGIEVYSRLRLNAGTLTVYYAESSSTTTSATVPGSPVYTQSGIGATNLPWYHKFGCYAQSNATTDTSGIKCLVYVRDWKQWHTGWPAPVTGNYAGPGGTGGTGTPGTPLVSAGADATVTPGATFSRTAQVTGSGITSQGWRLVGAAGATTDPATAAGKLNWGVPDPLSDEFNYTGAPDTNRWTVDNTAGRNNFGVRSAQRISVSNGVCTITGLTGSANTGRMAHKLNRQYGKTEVRMRCFYTSDPTAPGDKTGGYDPTIVLWTDSVASPGNGEYDIVQNSEPGQQGVNAVLHYPSLDGVDHSIDVPDLPVDMRQFHNYGVEWTSTSVKLYVDGNLWYTASGGAAADRKNIQAMDSATHLALQLDAAAATGQIGSAMEIEWARLYPVTPVTANAQVSTTPQVNWIVPTVPGTYTLEFFATNASGTSTDQVDITVGAATGGGDTGGGTGGTGGTGGGTGQTLGIGGIATPAPASNVRLYNSDQTSRLVITQGGMIYDGGGKKCPGIDVKANDVVIQNFDLTNCANYGVYGICDRVKVRNCRITQCYDNGIGDINGITLFGDDNEVSYCEIGTDTVNLVKGDAGGSHTDGFQTWDTSSKKSTSRFLFKGNRVVGPGANDQARLHQGVMAEGPNTSDGGGGGPGRSANWTIEDCYFVVNGGSQTIKLDDIHDVVIRRCTFNGNTSKIVATGSASTGINFVTSGPDANIIRGSYGSLIGG
jgi:hypothetical protein